MSLRDEARRTSKRGGQTESSTLKIVFLAVILVAIIGSAVVLFCKGRQLQVAIQRETLCPADSSLIPEITVVLLDTSDPLSAAQRIDTENRLSRLRDSLPRFGRIEVYALEQDLGEVARPLIVVCNPGDGSEMSEIYENPKLARKRWLEFADRLSRQFDEMLEAPMAPTSPIMEGVQAVAVRTFGKPEFDRARKRFVIVSDLLQHVPERFSIVRGLVPFSTFRRSPAFAAVRTDLTGVDVEIIYLTRPASAVQGGAHVQFWDDFFRAQGATVKSVTRI